MKWVQISVRC